MHTNILLSKNPCLLWNMVKCLSVIHLSFWFSKCIFMFLSRRINTRGCCCVKCLYACEFACVYGQHVELFFSQQKGTPLSKIYLFPSWEFLMFLFFQMDNFIFLILKFYFFCSCLYLSTADTGHQGMLYNYNKILKCHIELYSSSTFKVF